MEYAGKVTAGPCAPAICLRLPAVRDVRQRPAAAAEPDAYPGKAPGTRRLAGTFSEVTWGCSCNALFFLTAAPSRRKSGWGRRLSHTFTAYDKTDPGQVVDGSKDATIIINNKVKLTAPTSWRSCRDLKLIAVAATGTDVIDKKYCREHGIAVSNIRGYAVTPCRNIRLP